ncbi:MAG TPA: RDD family protein [Candidatus Saccharimonadia bacterium]|nr:RDD family protein [Candidatus Saccharimonadia bacterium]
MSEYHLNIAEKQTGPHSQFFIIQGIREGRLHGAEMVWRIGLEGWQPLRDLEDFSSYWPPSPEVLAKAESAKELARTELDRPQPWLRFWARMIDLIWFCCAFFIIVHMLMPEAMKQITIFAVRWYIPMEPFILLFYVPVEAWMLSRYGTTPGKSLLRIQVRTLPGALPTFRQAAHRSFLVCIKGLALGLPFISMLVMLWWKLQLAQARPTPWDETAETRVEHGEPEGWRYMLLVGIVLGVTMTFILFLIQNWPELEAARRNYLSK